MAIFLNNKAGFKIASIDLSAFVSSITINRVLEQLDVTAMGDSSRKFTGGLRADSITVSLFSDTATASVLQTLQDAFGTTVAVSMIQVKGDPVSATNKTYATTVLVDSLNDINGGVGDMATLDLTFTCNSPIEPSSSVAF